MIQFQRASRLPWSKNFGIFYQHLQIFSLKHPNPMLELVIIYIKLQVPFWLFQSPTVYFIDVYCQFQLVFSPSCFFLFNLDSFPKWHRKIPAVLEEYFPRRLTICLGKENSSRPLTGHNSSEASLWVSQLCSTLRQSRQVRDTDIFQQLLRCSANDFENTARKS